MGAGYRKLVKPSGILRTWIRYKNTSNVSIDSLTVSLDVSNGAGSKAQRFGETLSLNRNEAQREIAYSFSKENLNVDPIEMRRVLTHILNYYLFQLCHMSQERQNMTHRSSAGFLARFIVDINV